MSRPRALYLNKELYELIKLLQKEIYRAILNVEKQLKIQMITTDTLNL